MVDMVPPSGSVINTSVSATATPPTWPFNAVAVYDEPVPPEELFVSKSITGCMFLTMARSIFGGDPAEPLLLPYETTKPPSEKVATSGNSVTLSLFALEVMSIWLVVAGLPLLSNIR